MTTNEFEQKIKNLSADFSVVPNPNRPGLANIFYKGANYDLPVISAHEVKEEVDHSYRYEFPNGYSARHHSAPEIMTRLEDFLENFENIQEAYAE